MLINPGLAPSTVPGPGLAGSVVPPAPALDPNILNSVAHPNDDGSVDLLPPANDDDDPDALRNAPHGANLAELLSDDVLSKIGQELIEGIDADVDSNSEWYDAVEASLKLLGLKPGERIDTPYVGAPASTSSVLKEAVIRFAASASGEMLPADGPVRIKINSDPTPDMQAMADRKGRYMNYFLTEEDADYYDDYDQMLLKIGLYGHMYRKVWRDPLRGGVPTSRHYSPWDIIVSAQATTLTGSYRVTHLEPMARGDLTKLQHQAWYRNIDLAEPVGDADSPAGRVKELVGWRRPTELPKDADYMLAHTCCMYDLEGLEHEIEGEGGESEKSGIPLPYIVTLERETGKVLRMTRNWAEGDPSYKPVELFVVHRYMPGLDFMGWGLGHLLGSDTDTLTMLLRQALTSFTFASFPGGLKRRGTKTEEGGVQLSPGQFADIETGGAPIGEAVMALPFHDLPASYTILQQDILTAAQRMGSIGDMAVGDANDMAAVGTVLSLVKQATKMESSVIKRLHRAQRRELRLLADLMGQDKKDVYPFTMNGQTGEAITADFAPPNADVSPVSDPNIPTQTERLSMAQATLTVAQNSGGAMPIRPALEDFLRSMGKTDQELARLLPPPQVGQPSDPVTEFAMAQQGLPLKADPMQNHAAHIQGHMGQVAIPGIAPMIQQALLAHIGEHTAMFYSAEVGRISGQQMPPPLPPQGAGAPPPPPNPQMDQMVSAAVAQAANALHVSMAQLMPPVPGDPLGQAKIALEEKKLQAKSADQAQQIQADAQQAQVETQNLAMTLQDKDAERAAEAADQQNDIQREAIKARSAVAQSAMEHATSAADNQTDIIVAGLKAQSTHAAAHADVAAETEKTTQAKHKAEATKVAARARPKGAK
jgi:hypothetical protein